MENCCNYANPKVSNPVHEGDYRPISITSNMSRLIERLIVKHFIYPALQSPPPDLKFDDQFAFRPTGSTTAALITLLNSITDKMSSNDSGGSKGWATWPWPSPIIISRFFNVRFLMSFQRYFWIRLLIQAIKQSHSTIDAALFCLCANLEFTY